MTETGILDIDETMEDLQQRMDVCHTLSVLYGRKVTDYKVKNNLMVFPEIRLITTLDGSFKISYDLLYTLYNSELLVIYTGDIFDGLRVVDSVNCKVLHTNIRFKGLVNSVDNRNFLYLTDGNNNVYYLGSRGEIESVVNTEGCKVLARTEGIKNDKCRLYLQRHNTLEVYNEKLVCLKKKEGYCLIEEGIDYFDEYIPWDELREINVKVKNIVTGLYNELDSEYNCIHNKDVELIIFLDKEMTVTASIDWERKTNLNTWTSTKLIDLLEYLRENEYIIPKDKAIAGFNFEVLWKDSNKSVSHYLPVKTYVDSDFCQFTKDNFVVHKGNSFKVFAYGSDTCNNEYTGDPLVGSLYSNIVTLAFNGALSGTYGSLQIYKVKRNNRYGLMVNCKVIVPPIYFQTVVNTFSQYSKDQEHQDDAIIVVLHKENHLFDVYHVDNNMYLSINASKIVSVNFRDHTIIYETENGDETYCYKIKE
jgi:hypothetical protein